MNNSQAQSQDTKQNPDQCAVGVFETGDTGHFAQRAGGPHRHSFGRGGGHDCLDARRDARD